MPRSMPTFYALEFPAENLFRISDSRPDQLEAGLEYERCKAAEQNGATSRDYAPMTVFIQAALGLAITGILLLLLHSIVLRPLQYLHRVLPDLADREDSTPYRHPQ